jgi:hypothetical protein
MSLRFTSVPPVVDVRTISCIDPFGYLWEFSHPVAGDQPADSFTAAHDAWFGDDAT